MGGRHLLCPLTSSRILLTSFQVPLLPVSICCVFVTDNFRRRNLHHFADTWDSLVAGTPSYGVVCPWTCPQPCISKWQGALSGVRGLCNEDNLATFEGRQHEMAWPSGVGLPPRVVNAISVEPTKPRLILSMRVVNLFAEMQSLPSRFCPRLPSMSPRIPSLRGWTTQGSQASVPHPGIVFLWFWVVRALVSWECLLRSFKKA